LVGSHTALFRSSGHTPENAAMITESAPLTGTCPRGVLGVSVVSLVQGFGCLADAFRWSGPDVVISGNQWTGSRGRVAIAQCHWRTLLAAPTIAVGVVPKCAGETRLMRESATRSAANELAASRIWCQERRPPARRPVASW